MRFTATVAILGIIGLFVGYTSLYLSSEENLTIHVEDKERLTQSTGNGIESNWIVFAEEGEFTVEDSLLYLDWRASSRYNELKVGKACDVTVVGWRIGVFSTYQNIVKVGECR